MHADRKSWGVGAPLWRENMLPLIFISPQVKVTAAKDEYRTSSTDYTMRTQKMRVKLINSGGQVELVEE